MKKHFSIITLVIVFGLLSFSNLSCQNTTDQPKFEIAINPIFVPAGTITGEFETIVKPHLTVGMNLWYEYKEVEARFAYFKLLYHPNPAGLAGLGFGPTAGVITRYREEDKPEQKANDTAPTLGGIVQYNWLFGKYDNFLLGVGFNLHAILKNYTSDSPLRRVDGDLRLVAGYAW